MARLVCSSHSEYVWDRGREIARWSRRRGSKLAILWLSHMGIHERQADRRTETERLAIRSAANTESSYENIFTLLSDTGLYTLG